ncbi:hypothetical protein TNIN_156021 [Trichonephila inaurata madagascariensis]|uniref:Uncharacterized protein n=1 Tax=Trichonephila inaurata madagascariensis TaxID=2747483 RepID=A0A8X6Y432_9ARAC|nr:hypothetical protein TNIN_156021 [Trichonephila inaurata madagascariensis]
MKSSTIPNLGRRVVRSGSNSLYSQHLFQAVEKTRLELASLVCGYDGRYTEARYPVSDEAFCHGFSGDIGNDLRPSGVAINLLSNVSRIPMDSYPLQMLESLVNCLPFLKRISNSL